MRHFLLLWLYISVLSYRAALEATPSVERMKSDVIINLDRDDVTYTAGDVIKGHVEVALTNEVKVRGQRRTNINQCVIVDI